jgi:rod shape-determining protein MreC
MLKRPHYIALGLVLLMTLIILNLPSQTTARLKLGIGSAFLPLFGLASSTHQLAAKAGDTVVPRSQLLKENETFRREHEQTRIEMRHAEEIARENDRLRQLFGWQQQKRWNLKLGNVILREPANWWRTVQIDLGSRDGVRLNMPVLAWDGYLVGRVSQVSLTRSQVVLLGDPNCQVSALVENDARDIAIIGASGPLDSTLVEMTYLSRNANVKSGQNVVTSGLGGIFPKAIPIGKIVDSHAAEYGLYTEARVKLAANLSALDEVWVLFQP